MAVSEGGENWGEFADEFSMNFARISAFSSVGILLTDI